MNAITIAKRAHLGQTRRDGEPYFNHCERVASYVIECSGSTHQIEAAYLHDTLEDTPVTAHDLVSFGIDQRVIGIVEALTHRPDEEYEDYIKRVFCHEPAILVKLADLQDNVSGLLHDAIPEHYAWALDFLRAKREEVVVPCEDCDGRGIAGDDVCSGCQGASVIHQVLRNGVPVHECT